MSSERVKELLQQLREELAGSNVDPAMLSRMRKLEADIQRGLESADEPAHALADRARAAEVNFAVKHGVAEKILRELIDTLAKMGV